MNAPETVTIAAAELKALRALRDVVQRFQFQFDAARRAVKTGGGAAELAVPIQEFMEHLFAVSTAEDGMSITLPSAHPWLDHSPKTRGQIVLMLMDINGQLRGRDSITDDAAIEILAALGAAIKWLMLPGVCLPACPCGRCNPTTNERPNQ